MEMRLLPKAQHTLSVTRTGSNLQLLSIANSGLASLEGLGLERLTSLALLNISSNNLRSLSGVGGMRRLQELWASHNRLRQTSELRGLS